MSRIILGLGLGLIAAFAAGAATAPASEALERRPTCGPSAWVPRERAPIASRDGRVLAWSAQSHSRSLHRVVVSAADGSGVRHVSVPGRGDDKPLALAPDGHELLIERAGNTRALDACVHARG